MICRVGDAVWPKPASNSLAPGAVRMIADEPKDIRMARVTVTLSEIATVLPAVQLPAPFRWQLS